MHLLRLLCLAKCIAEHSTVQTVLGKSGSPIAIPDLPSRWLDGVG